MVPSTTFPNPRRFPQQQEVVKSTCRCMYWFRRLKYCAPCHPVVFAFAPSSCWLRLELFFDDYTNFNGGQSDLQRRSTNLWFLKFDVGAAITSKEVDFARCFELSWCVTRWRNFPKRNNEQHRLPSRLLQHQRQISNLKFVERLWRSDCPPLRFEKIIDLLFSSVLPHGVSWYDACEVSPPVVVVSGRCWWSAVRVVAHAVVVERRSVPISKDWGWWKQF